jgi:hypothetical protein
MTDLAHTKERRRRAHGAATGLWFALATLAALIVLAAVFVLMMGPRWSAAPVAPDAPSVPLTVGGVLFNVPPAAIRLPIQRTPGTHERLDLAFLWPSLAPPGPAAKPSVSDEPPPIDRMFVTIMPQTVALSPDERVKTIYPRYLADVQFDGPDGLKVISFRDGTPYQGEDLFFDPTTSGGFLVRCTRPGAAHMPGMCLCERRIGNADLTFRFPSEWLTGWRKVAAGIERLIASWKVTAG